MPDPSPNPAQLFVDAGVCYVHFAYDIGFSIDLDRAERHIRETKHRGSLRRTRKAPQYFEYRPPPLRVTLDAATLPVAGFATEKTLDLALYDFGAVSVIYRIPLSGDLIALQQLGLALYDNQALLDDSRRHVQLLIDAIEPAVTKPNLSALVEDYVIFHITRSTPACDPSQVLSANALPLAQMLRAESDVLSVQEIDDSLAQRISFSTEDLMVIDWNASFVLGADMDDVLAVLEFANVELLEMRFLDDQLDRALTEAYSRFSKRRRSGSWKLRPRAAVLEGIARLQLDSAMLFEGVNNTLKLMGDPYLARVYRLASQRFHLGEWDVSILRKLEAVESIYSKIADQQSTWRMEMLEWIIILLFLVSILVSFK